ncbi:MAG: glycosyltransferase family 2 protein [Acidimicrobiia bacterium]|nr:glycosyltransferase family 2 protein [Acidimicrobiia bacterium]
MSTPHARRPGRRVWYLVFLVLAAANIAAVPVWGATNRLTGDEPHYLMTAESILSDGDLDLADEYATRAHAPYHHEALRPQEVPRPDGARLSPHGPGLALVLLPGYAVGGWVGARVELALVAAAVLTGAGYLAARFVRRPAWVAPAATLAAGLSVPLWVYSTQVYPEMPAAAILVGAALVWTGGSDRRRPEIAAVGLGLMVGVLLLLGLKYAPVAVTVAAVSAWRLRRNRRALALLVGVGGIACLGQAAFNVATYGGISPYSTNVVYAGRSNAFLVADNAGGLARTYRLHGLVLDRHFGIGRYAPVWFAALAAVPVMLVRRDTRAAWTPLAALVAVQWATATWLALTMRGYWFPGRQVVAILPLLVPALAFALARVPALVAALGAVSVGVGAWMVYALDTAQVGAGRNPFWLPLPGFVPAGAAFPDYRTVTVPTVVLPVAWCVLFVALVTVLYRRALPGVGRRPVTAGDDLGGIRLLVGFPARNEAPTVADLVRRARALDTRVAHVDVVVVDDASADETASEATAAGARVLPVADGRTGLGAGVRTILAEATRTGSDWVAFMDADGEYAPEDIPGMIATARSARLDYVTGDRLAQGRPLRMPVWRWLGNRAGSFVVSCLAGLRIRDSQSGIRVLSARAARRAEIPHDYNYAQVLTLALARVDCRMGEVPVSYTRRAHGRTFVRLPVYLWRVVPAMWEVMTP